jgi:FemAB-related protein (PEP-CTERM system-associated)
MSAALSLLRQRPIAGSPVRHAPLVEVLAPQHASAWDDYVVRQPNATPYHLHAWRDVAARAYRLETTFLVARDAPGGPLRGVLPLFRAPRPTVPYLTTGLFGAYGSLLADDDACARALLAAAVECVDRGDVAYLHLKLLGGVPEGLPLRRHDAWVTVRRELETSDDALFGSFSSGMRNKIRHAQRAGLTFHRTRADLGAFYDVLSANMHRKGAPIYGRRFFDLMLDALGSRVEVVTLRHEQRVVSGAIVTWMGETAYLPFSSSLPSAFRLRANNLLYWEVMRMARTLGARTLDLGSSLRDSTGLDFKLGWRAAIEPIGSYVYAGAGVRPVLVPTGNPIASAVVQFCRWLPRPLYESVGPTVCRWIV